MSMRSHVLVLSATILLGLSACDEDSPVRIDAATGTVPDAAATTGDTGGGTTGDTGGGANLDTATGTSNVDGGAAGTDALAGATWTNIYNTIITVRCMPCHTTATGTGAVAGMLDMSSKATAYMNLLNISGRGAGCAGQGTRVVPEDSSASLLILKLSSDVAAPCGAKMPLGRAALPDSEVELIEEWIDDGAENN